MVVFVGLHLSIVDHNEQDQKIGDENLEEAKLLEEHEASNKNENPHYVEEGL